jgi:hypothetical protein
VKFNEANYDDGTLASADLLVKASRIGDCGDAFVITVTLSEESAETATYTLNVTETSIFSAEGQTFNQVIHRDAKCYDIVASIKATEAQTAAEHTAQCSGVCFLNVLTD